MTLVDTFNILRSRVCLKIQVIQIFMIIVKKRHLLTLPSIKHSTWHSRHVYTCLLSMKCSCIFYSTQIWNLSNAVTMPLVAQAWQFCRTLPTRPFPFNTFSWDFPSTEADSSINSQESLGHNFRDQTPGSCWRWVCAEHLGHSSVMPHYLQSVTTGTGSFCSNTCRSGPATHQMLKHNQIFMFFYRTRVSVFNYLFISLVFYLYSQIFFL